MKKGQDFLLKEKKVCSSPQKTRAAALSLLSRRIYAKKELEDKLRQKGAAAADISAVISEMEELGLVDDAHYAEALICHRKSISPKGRFFVARELREKGVAPAMADAALAKFYSPEEEEAIIRSLLEKDLAKALPQERQDRLLRERLLRKMAAKGFPLGPVLAFLAQNDIDWETLDI